MEPARRICQWRSLRTRASPEQQAEFYAALNAINSSPLVRDVVAENGRLSVEVEVLRCGTV